jgi:hypothetical protein
MMGDGPKRRHLVIALVVVVPLLVLAVWGLTVAGSAGVLPWQPEPTRIPITPFANLPELSSAGTPTP